MCSAACPTFFSCCVKETRQWRPPWRGEDTWYKDGLEEAWGEEEAAELRWAYLSCVMVLVLCHSIDKSSLMALREVASLNDYEEYGPGNGGGLV